MFEMKEPLWGENFLKMMNGWMAQHELAMKMVPILADVFVFSYPVYLLVLYFVGIGKKKDYYQNAALMLFFAGFGSVFVNVLIQSVVQKVRPDKVLELMATGRDALLMQHVPADTFPSDHAAMAAAIATVTLLRGVRHKDKTFVMLSLPLILFAVIMGFGRITVGVHWPTDILAGTIVGIMVSILMFEKHIFAWLKKWVFAWVNKVVGKVVGKVFLTLP